MLGRRLPDFPSRAGDRVLVCQQFFFGGTKRPGSKMLQDPHGAILAEARIAPLATAAAPARRKKLGPGQ